MLAPSQATGASVYKLRNQPFILSRIPLPSSRLDFVSRTYRTWGRQARGARGQQRHARQIKKKTRAKSIPCEGRHPQKKQNDQGALARATS